MANDKWNGSNPWLGLAPYTEGTALYGRTQESTTLSEIIKGNIATIVYGKSGVGKSSLLSAGISPMLRSEQYIPVPLRLVHNTDVSYVEQIENRVRELVDCKDELPENVPNLGLWDFFHRNTFTKDGVSCQPVIILDQFEEIYTLTDVEYKPEIITLFTELASLLNDIKPDAVLAAESSFNGETADETPSDDDFSFELSSEPAYTYNDCINFRFVICLREDKLYLLERNSANIPSIKANRYNLQALSSESALEVITCPRPDLFTNEEATAIVDKLADMGDEGIRTVDPAILSLFLYKYYEKKGGANYDNIFADYYREATKGIKEKSLAFLEDHLLTLGGYRNQIPVDDALSSGVSKSEIDSLLKQIILRSEKRKGIDYVEFSHDRLCAEAKKSRDERIIRQQKKKLLSRALWGILFLSAIISLGILYIIDAETKNQNLEKAKQDIETKNKNLEIAYKSLKARELENDSINKSLTDQILLNEKQKDSLRFSYRRIESFNRLLTLSRDSLARINKELEIAKKFAEEAKKIAEEAQRFAEKNRDLVIEASQNTERENAQTKNIQPTMSELITINKAFDFFMKIRDVVRVNSLLQLSYYTDSFDKYGLTDFPSLRITKGESISLNGHFIYNEEFIKLCSRDGIYPNADICDEHSKTAFREQMQGQFALYKNLAIKANSSLALSFPSRGYQEIAVITEPEGLVSLRIHVTNSKGVDEWHISTNNFKKGEPYRKIPLTLPTDILNIVEVEVINCTNMDISFVLLSN